MNCLTNCVCILTVVACYFNLGHSETPALCSVVQGLPGLNGRDGRDGINGPKGDPGARGEPGISGERGIPGPPGKVGPKGNPGEKGNIGATGLTGNKGEKGDTGVGLSGEKGEKGDKGCTDVDSGKRTDALESRIVSLEKRLSKLENVLLFHGGKVGSKIFVTNGREETYHNAQKICREAGGTLAAPRNAAENIALEGIIGTTGGTSRVFLGISDIQIEGTFTYLTGEKIVFTNWNSGEPNNNKDSEDCVEILNNGKWNDIPCGEKRLVICEFQ